MKPFTRVVVFITSDGFSVAGYRRGVFEPQGNFAAIGDAMEHALTLPVKDPRNPVNVVRDI